MTQISQQEFEQLAKEHVPFVGMLGIQVENIEAGQATIRIPFRDDFIRPGGTVAGPVQIALADNSHVRGGLEPDRAGGTGRYH